MKNQIRILIIEENTIIRKDLLSLLRSWGYAMITFSSNDPEAIQRALEQQPDIVIKDVFFNGHIPEAGKQHRVISIDKPFDEMELQLSLEAACKALAKEKNH